VPLAIEEGSTENATLVTSLIVGLRERGLDVTRPILAVLDGSRALARAVKDVFDCPVIARCHSTRSGMCGTGCRTSCGRWWSGGCVRRTTPSPRWPPRPSWRRWPASWTRPTRAQLPACAKAWKRL
jgi:hypothetical protein